MREKIRMKKIDRKVYVDEMEGVLSANREKRNALRIGNDCLRFMTKRQENLSIAINGRIFSERPREERLPMLKCTLQNSIVNNDHRLFRFGKRLLKQDCVKERRIKQEKEQSEELKRALNDKDFVAKDFEDRSEHFLHKQAEVEDFHNRDVSAKLIYQRLEKILDQLNKSLGEYPQMIRDLESQLNDRRRELADFEDLKAGALRFLDIEQRQLDPLNEELQIVTSHFEALIAVEKNELDDRRKKSSLSKFLSERENQAFNFTAGSNILETKIKVRNSALVNARDTLIQIMDAMLLTDLSHVVDSIVDQEEVTELLNKEKEKRQAESSDLLANMERLNRNYQYLMYNGIKQAKAERDLKAAVDREHNEMTRFNNLDKDLRAQDQLISGVTVALHALFEKLRPVKIKDADNLFTGELIMDAKNFSQKVKKMIALIEARTVPVGQVKPLMLHVYQQKRVPPDSVRVVLRDQIREQSMGTFDAYEADQPGFISRDMLKARADEANAPKKKRKMAD